MKTIKKTIPLPLNGRRFAISDIHGCSKTFKALLDSIKLTKSDQLFILGDFINRGKRSKAVVKSIIDMSNNGYQIFALRGNHEDFFATYIEKSIYNRRLEFLARSGLLSIANDYGVIKDKYRDFFLSLPFYYESGNIYLVHAGFDLNNNPLENTDAMTTIRNMDCVNFPFENKFIVHGHTPISIGKIEDSIIQKHNCINIDNGCILKTIPGKGSLICLNLDSFEIHKQRNID